MHMKNIVIAGAVIIVILGIAYFFTQQKAEAPTDATADQEMGANEDRVFDNIDSEYQDTNSAPSDGKLKVGNFTGTLESVDTGCYVDAECFVVVDGKHVTVLTGMRLMEQEVGSVLGTDDGIGGLETAIGQEVEVYAKDNSDGTYTLYGSEGFYVKLLK